MTHSLDRDPQNRITGPKTASELGRTPGQPRSDFHIIPGGLVPAVGQNPPWTTSRVTKFGNHFSKEFDQRAYFRNLKTD